MTLETYRKKRNFARTPEPAPRGVLPDIGDLRFVVQKHEASHLHYDFRLELDGALKSWAVPKGPSLDPAQKRLAMMVEDHPMEYRTFEGVIPEGNYGAGTVMVWDEGTYRAIGATTREESEQMLREALAKGRLKLALRGEKLKGEFSLSKMHGGSDRGNSWLLIKKEDDFATRQDVLLWDRSVQSGRTMSEIASPGAPEWQSNREDDDAGGRLAVDQSDAQNGGANETRVAGSPRPPSPPSGVDIARLDLTGARKAAKPHKIKPMLATLTDEAFDREGWLFELKWDGYRAIAEVGGGGVELYSRNFKSFNERYAAIFKDLQTLEFDAVLDGEVVVLDEQGHPQFKLLQDFAESRRGTLVYFVFDVLYLEGFDLRDLPLARRKAILKAIMPPDLLHIRWSDYIEERGRALFDSAREADLEGIIAKDASSSYRAATRTESWLKIKTRLTQSAVIAGFTEPRGGRKDLGALILGVYEGKELVYIGHTGGGFTQEELAHVKGRLEPLIARKPPFAAEPPTNAPPTWVEPKLVCDVRFAEWSRDGLMRQPIFIGLRDDVDPKTICRELPVPVAKAVAPRRYRPRGGQDEQIVIDGRTLTLTNLDKLYWPNERLTKRDLISYYRGIAPLILPYLVDRPESLHRFPNGINSESFFQKDVAGQVPEWAETVVLGHEESPETYLLCQDEATLVLMANMGCIEINPWNSRRETLNNPDFLVIDLDPVDIPFVEVVHVALGIHDLLAAADIPNYCKTSGATGLHINVPLAARYPYDQVREFAQLIAYLANDRFQKTTSVERNPEKRKGKIYLDYLQNRRGQTMAAPYSLRPRPGAPVSTPLLWAEVTPGLTPVDHNIHTIGDRIAKHGDLWQPVIGPGIDMAASLRRLEQAARS